MRDDIPTQEEMVETLKWLLFSDLEDLMNIYKQEDGKELINTRSLESIHMEFISTLGCAAKLGFLDPDICKELSDTYYNTRDEFVALREYSSNTLWVKPTKFFPEDKTKEIAEKIKSLINDPRNKLNHKYEIVIKD